jgi:exonuclease VII large subunit
MKLPEMQIIKDAKEVQKGDEINIRLHNGEVICVVSKSKPS